jgi:ribonuclease HI
MKFRVPITFDAVDETDANAIVKALLAVMQDHGVKPKAGPVVDAIASEEGVIVIYTDGGCDLKKDGLGAWAYLIEMPDGTTKEASEPFIGTTNNRMEMMAVIKALEGLEFGPPIKVVADSEYVIKGVTQWSRNWIRNGWRTRDGKPVVNKDLWEQLIALYQLHAVTFEHVKGHTGHPGNEHVDSLCTASMQEAHKAVLAGEDVPLDDGCMRIAA